MSTSPAKILGLIVVGAIFTGALAYTDFTRNPKEPQKPTLKEVQASIIQQLQTPKKREITLDDLKKIGLETPGIRNDGATNIFLDEVNISPIQSEKITILNQNEERATINIIRDPKKYGLILTESYNQKESAVTELDKNSYIIKTNDKILYVTYNDQSIIGLVYEPQNKEFLDMLLTRYGYDIPQL